jgi:hypothetical protein
MINPAQQISAALSTLKIPVTETEILTVPSIVGYNKQFRWAWMATQLNTFITVTDGGDELITPQILWRHQMEAFENAKINNTGWPRGLQSGLASISIIISTNLSQEAKDYCTALKAEKRLGGFTIPVVIDGTTGEVFRFKKKPYWGRIYYNFFGEMIDTITVGLNRN